MPELLFFGLAVIFAAGLIILSKMPSSTCGPDCYVRSDAEVFEGMDQGYNTARVVHGEQCRYRRHHT